MTRLSERASDVFLAVYGRYPELIARAPGRVNIIGEHTDYNDGFVLPVAIDRDTCVAIRPRDDRTLRAVAADLSNAEDTFEIDAPAVSASQPWSNYLRGMVAELAEAGLSLRGADIAVCGDIPRGSGLSSSASLCVAFGLGLVAASGNTPLAAETLAAIAQRAEWRFAGTRCGIMDQLVSCAGREDHALLIDCRSLKTHPVAISAAAGLIIVHSGITRGLVEGAYNQRRAQCELIARSLGVKALRDLSEADLAAAAPHLDAEAVRRARHVVTENARTILAAARLAASDLAGLGRLMAASHASMRDDFNITLPAIDMLVDDLVGLIGEDGGARMTGGGFGGAVIAVMPAHRRDAVAEAIGRRYRTPTGDPPLILKPRAAGGASLL